MFGGLIAQGLTEVGKGATDAYNVYGQVAADQATNNFLGKLTNIRTNFEQTKGQGTIDAYRGNGDDHPGFQKSVQSAYDEARSTVPPGFQNNFDTVARRYQFMTNSAAQTHFATQSSEWAKTVATDSENHAVNGVSSQWSDDAAFDLNRHQLASATAKQVQITQGLPDYAKANDQQKQIYDDAIGTANGKAWYYRIEAARAAGNNAQALQWQKDHADDLGKLGPEVQRQMHSYEAAQDIDASVNQKLAEAGTGTPGSHLAASGDPSAALIRSREGFRSTAYWDVNHWRTGYGSDTITLPDGSVRSVGPNTTVTQADAERDLTRRTNETQAQIAGQVGFGQWQALPGGAKAALTSMSYNYGLLPFDVQAAVRGGNIADIARSIEGHAGDNGGVNRARRMQEASIAMGGPIPAGGALAQSQTQAPSGVAGIADYGLSAAPVAAPISPFTPASIEAQPTTPGAPAPEEGAQVQQAGYQQVSREGAGGALGGAPPVQQGGMETAPEQQSAWDIVRDRTSAAMMATMSDPNIPEDKKDKMLAKMERDLRNATFGAEQDAATRTRHSQEAIDRAFGIAMGGNGQPANPQGGFNALDDAFQRGLIDEQKYYTAQTVIEKRTGAEDLRSYGPGYHNALMGVLAAPGQPNRVHDISDLLNMEAAEQITSKGYEKLRQDFNDVQKGDDEFLPDAKEVRLRCSSKISGLGDGGTDAGNERPQSQRRCYDAGLR